MESMFGWAAINAILVAYGFGQKKWKFLIIPIAVKLCFWIASIYYAQLSYEERGGRLESSCCSDGCHNEYYRSTHWRGDRFYPRRNKTKSEK